LRFDSIFAADSRYSKLVPVALAASLMAPAIFARAASRPVLMVDGSIDIAGPAPQEPGPACRNYG